jgi:transposase
MDPSLTKSIHKRVKGRSNCQTSSNQRNKLIQYVVHYEMQINHAAQQLGMNYSTAKSIMHLYNRTGRIEKAQKGGYMVRHKDREA